MLLLPFKSPLQKGHPLFMVTTGSTLNRILDFVYKVFHKIFKTTKYLFYNETRQGNRGKDKIRSNKAS